MLGVVRIQNFSGPKVTGDTVVEYSVLPVEVTEWIASISASGFHLNARLLHAMVNRMRKEPRNKHGWEGAYYFRVLRLHTVCSRTSHHEKSSVLLWILNRREKIWYQGNDRRPLQDRLDHGEDNQSAVGQEAQVSRDGRIAQEGALVIRADVHMTGSNPDQADGSGQRARPEDGTGPH
jgi:hypothetical protein